MYRTNFPVFKQFALRSWRLRTFSLIFVVLSVSSAGISQKAKPDQLTARISSPEASASDGSAQVASHEQQIHSQDLPGPAEKEKNQQLADEGAWLFQLATGLKTEVDKTNMDILSLNVIHKATEIEKLAHYVKEGNKLSSGSK